MKSLFTYLTQIVLLALLFVFGNAGLGGAVYLTLGLFLLTLVSDLKQHLTRLAPKITLNLDDVSDSPGHNAKPYRMTFTEKSLLRGSHVPEGSLVDEIRSGRISGILPDKSWPEPTGFSERELADCQATSLASKPEKVSPYDS
jgi:hypothetical protein